MTINGPVNKAQSRSAAYSAICTTTVTKATLNNSQPGVSQTARLPYILDGTRSIIHASFTMHDIVGPADQYNTRQSSRLNVTKTWVPASSSEQNSQCQPTCTDHGHLSRKQLRQMVAKPNMQVSSTCMHTCTHTHTEMTTYIAYLISPEKDANMVVLCVLTGF